MEAEGGESLEPGGEGCSQPRSQHSTPAWVTKVKLSKKKKITEKLSTRKLDSIHKGIKRCCLSAEITNQTKNIMNLKIS